MKPDHTIDQDYVKLSNRRPVRAQSVPRQPDYIPHDHEFYELCWVSGGRALHRTTEGDEWLGRGSVVVVAPGQLHSFDRTEGFSVVNVYYLAEWFLAGGMPGRMARLRALFFQRALLPSREPGGVVHLKLSEPEMVACLRDLADMESEGERPDVNTLFLEATFFKCLVRLLRSEEMEGCLAEEGTPVQAVVERGIALLEEQVRIGAVLDVRSVAQRAGASFSHFCRIFAANTGMTAGEYFQRRRIHRACHRLLTTGESATELAHELGYADSAHFIRRFKQATGLTPRAYRLKFSAR